MNAAAIKVSSGKSVEELNVPGILNVLLTHKVESTASECKWMGPVINPGEWARMMAFFEWTYETEKSEAQVRWYVHPQHGWKCWAFPQKGGTSMTTREIEGHPNHIEQRKQYPANEGWQYFMTVHHHCSIGAFQSPTDRNDEEKVDGIHITIGKMNEPKRDIDVRMYLRGHKFEPRMHFFWEVGAEVMNKAKECYDLFGHMPDVDKIALIQMARSHALMFPDWTQEKDGDKFPPQWRENYIVEPEVHHSDWTPGQPYVKDGKTWCYECKEYVTHTFAQCPFRGKSNGNGDQVQQQQQQFPGHEGGKGHKRGKRGDGANGNQKDSGTFLMATIVRDIEDQLKSFGNTDEEVEAFLTGCFGSTDATNLYLVYSEMHDGGVEVDAMEKFYEELLEERAARRELAEQKAAQEEIKKEMNASHPSDPPPGGVGLTGWEQ